MSYQIAKKGFITVADKVRGGYSSSKTLPWLILDSEELLNPNKKFLWDYYLVLNVKFAQRLEKLKKTDQSLSSAEEAKLREMLESIINTKKLWDEVGKSCE